LAVAALLAFLPAAAAAQTVTAEQAMSNYRKVIKTTRELDCPRGGGDEIVVCGNQGVSETQQYLPPLPTPSREPGDRIKGEANFDGGGCIRLCHQPLKIDVIKAGKSIAKGIRRILGKD